VSERISFAGNLVVQVWKEGPTYVAYAPELDVSSCGRTATQAKSRLREAISLFVEESAKRVAKFRRRGQNAGMFTDGQRVRANLAGMQAGGVLFHAAVTDAVGNIVRQTSQNPPVYLVRLLFSFKGVNEIEVPEDRIRAA